MQYSLERSQNIVLTLKKKRLHVFFSEPYSGWVFLGLFTDRAEGR